MSGVQLRVPGGPGERWGRWSKELLYWFVGKRRVGGRSEKRLKELPQTLKNAEGGDGGAKGLGKADKVENFSVGAEKSERLNYVQGIQKSPGNHDCSVLLNKMGRGQLEIKKERRRGVRTE